MKRGIFDMSVLKNITLGRWHILGKAKDICQLRARRKGLVINISYGTSNGDGGQAGAKAESITFYQCHAAGDGDGGQAAAIEESICSYRFHAAGDGD